MNILITLTISISLNFLACLKQFNCILTAQNMCKSLIYKKTDSLEPIAVCRIKTLDEQEQFDWASPFLLLSFTVLADS